MVKVSCMLRHLVVQLIVAYSWFSGGHIVSPLSVRMSIPSVRPIRNKNSFRAISFERIGELD